MKKILLALFITLIYSFSFGQTFEMYPNDTIKTDLDPNDYTELKIHQINTTQAVLNLGIEVLHNDIPGTWDGMVCVYGACLGHIPVVGYMYDQSPVFAADSGYVRLTAHPMQGTQPCMLRIKVYDKDNPSNEEIATWILNQTLGIEDYSQKNIDFKVYPNPAKNQINLSSDQSFDELVLTTINGAVAKEMRFGNLLQYSMNVDDLQPGIYFLTAKSNGKPLVRSKVMISE